MLKPLQTLVPDSWHTVGSLINNLVWKIIENVKQDNNLSFFVEHKYLSAGRKKDNNVHVDFLLDVDIINPLMCTK